jgi:hypothetical protein
MATIKQHLFITTMDKQTFTHHFTSAIDFLIGFTQSFCYNNFPANHRFIIIPSSKMLAAQLTEQEIEILKSLARFHKKLFTKEEVINLLHFDNKVPLWINITIYESTPTMTVFKLLCDGRFRDDAELNYKADQYPPFHPLVPMPPENLKLSVNGKFDINWQQQTGNSKKRGTIFTRIRDLFKIK